MSAELPLDDQNIHREGKNPLSSQKYSVNIPLDKLGPYQNSFFHAPFIELRSTSKNDMKPQDSGNQGQQDILMSELHCQEEECEHRKDFIYSHFL